jgi:signal transduction histidine kinase
VRAVHYATAAAAVGLATVATFAMRPFVGPNVSLLFFPAVVITAMYGGYGPALVATVLSTASLAYFFVPPEYSFDVGADDAVQLGVFVVVAVATAWLSAARKRAEEAQRRALDELRGAMTVLRKVSGWPTFVDAGLSGGARRLLVHAGGVVGCARVVATWETEEEPWIYVAESDAASVTIDRYAPTTVWPAGPESEVATLECEAPYGERAGASAPFALEHLKSRVFFIRVHQAHSDILPLASIVAREVGNSLEQLYVHDRLQQLAVREDRIRVARDLHDGVLQSLTGIRFQLQAFAERPADQPAASDHLLAMERAIAIEQRELRRFIDDLKPAPRQAAEDRGVAGPLEELRSRLSAEWQIPTTVRVAPPDLRLKPSLWDDLRLLVREAAVNAVKHGHPSRLAIDVQAHGVDAIRVVVSDDGRGFPFKGRLTHDALVASAAGPVSLRERAEALGGSVSIESAPTGATVEIIIPAARATSTE